MPHKFTHNTIIVGGSLKSNSINYRIIQILCDEFLLSQLEKIHP